MNQAKINAIVRQIFVALGVIIAFVPSLSPLEAFLPDAQTILNELIGTAFALWSLIGQIRTILDSKSTEGQVQILNARRPSWIRGVGMYLKAA